MSDQSTVDHKAAIEDLQKQLAPTLAGQPARTSTPSWPTGWAWPTPSRRWATRPSSCARRWPSTTWPPPSSTPGSSRSQHARVLNAAGAAHRGLGDRRKAAELFEKAVALFAEGGTDNERAAAYNNLGLCRTELGQPEAGVEAFDSAIELFDSYTDEGKRGIMSTLHNRGQAHTGLGTEEGLEAALADFEEARGMIDPDENPLHHGMVEHSVGVTCSALAKLSEDGRSAFLQEAIRAFNNSLEVFTRTALPLLPRPGQAQPGPGPRGPGRHRQPAPGPGQLRGRARRLRHPPARRRLEAGLRQPRAGREGAQRHASRQTRTEHFVALLAVAGLEERTVLVRERMFRLLALPEPRRTPRSPSWPGPSGCSTFDEGRKVYESIMKLVIELPKDTQSVSLQAIIEGHRTIEDEEARIDADRALDQAIGDALGGPQRVAVRDFLEGEGWERP